MTIGLLHRLGATLRSRRSSVTILAAVMFPTLVGLVGLATEYGDGLLTQVKAQRLADAAAWSGALAYKANNTTSSMTSAANQIVALNGLATSALTTSLVSSPSGDGNSAVQATVTLDVPLAFTQLINSSSSQLTVTANSYVELKGGTIPCIIALSSSGTGITLSGSGKITANSCGVSSDATTTSPAAIVAPSSSASLTTPAVSTPQALTSTQKAHILPPSGVAAVNYVIKTVADPIGSLSSVTTAVNHLASVGLLSNPSLPSTIPSSTVDVSPSGSSWSGAGCTGTKSGSTWTITCSGNGPFNFRNLSLGGGLTLNFNTSGSSSAVYNFSGSVNTGSDPVTFGPGTYNIAQGLSAGGCSSCSVTFNGPGTYNIANYTSGTTTCSSGSYSISNTAHIMLFSNQSTFVLPCGIYNGGGVTLTLGSGSTSNSYQIGSSSTGYAINMGGGSTVVLNGATGTGDLFQTNGNISNGGGSCLTLPAASAHDINGSIILGGGATLGSGVYTIYDYIAVGAGGGGSVTCGNVSIGLLASNVTFVIGANATVSCTVNVGFCIAGGYSNVVLTAPSTGTLANIAVIGPTTSTNTAGATLAAGSSGANITGLFYNPYGTFTMSGSASVGGGGCFELIASQINLSGGTSVASTCAGLGGSSLGVTSIALVQ